MKGLVFILSVLSVSLGFGQDSLYTRKVLKYLASPSCYGRGYVRDGLPTAEKFLLREIARRKAEPLFGQSYTQAFRHNVNTFPEDIRLKVNDRKLKPGVDFVPSPANVSKKGKFRFTVQDSVTFVSEDSPPVVLVKRKKLTYSVADELGENFIIELDAAKVPEKIETAEISCKNELRKDFESKNIGCYLRGSSASDSLLVFTAHYDHLGGIGGNCYFPGANDNASGVSMLLNLLAHYSTVAPKYKTLFIFFTGEEAGLLGSKFFVENPAVDLSKIKFLVNLDLLGTGDDGIMVVNGSVHEKQFLFLEEINGRLNYVPQVLKRGKAANSDHYWFSEKGVPCFFIYTLGGIKAYHDVYDREETLPLTKYSGLFKLLISFVENL